MTRDNPSPNSRHETEDWDPAGKSEEEHDEPAPKPNTGETLDPVPDRPRDSEPAEIASSGRDDRQPSGGVEREQEPDSHSNF